VFLLSERWHCKNNWPGNRMVRAEVLGQCDSVSMVTQMHINFIVVLCCSMTWVYTLSLLGGKVVLVGMHITILCLEIFPLMGCPLDSLHLVSKLLKPITCGLE